MAIGMSDQVKIVRKGTKEFREARERFLALFRKDQPENMICAGNIGMTTRQMGKLKEIPMPFGCPDLELYVWPPNKDGSQSVAYFCGRVGCLCSCCREDMDGEYPSYCPDPDELDFEYDAEDDDFYEC